MKILEGLIQGSPQWLAIRAQHFTASEAPAMLGVSKYTGRRELLKQKATGIAPDVSADTQRLFDRGHAAEAAARSLAEAIVGSELYPVTCVDVVDDLPMLASMDGLTMDERIGFEHKLWNEGLAEQVRTGTLGPHYTAQMDQQLLVTGAEKILFMCSDGTPERMVWCWYSTDAERKQRLIAGWKQFEQDVLTYQPTEIAPIVVAQAVQALPSVSVSVTGSIAVRDNFQAFEERLKDFLANRLIREPKTDQDFSDLDLQIKALKGAEAALESAEQQMLAQIQTVDQAKKTKDMLHKLVRDNRLMAEKLLASEKERRKGELLAGFISAYAEHAKRAVDEAGVSFFLPKADFAGCIKGLKSLASMEEKLDAELARLKIECSRLAAIVHGNRQRMLVAASDHLFPDFAQVCTKAHEDFEALIIARQADATRRLEAERERIRKEELARIAHENATRAEADLRSPNPFDSEPAQAIKMEVGVVYGARIINSTSTLKLGEINARLGVTVTSDLLARLGFQPVVQGASKLFHESDFPAICEALVKHIRAAAQAKAA